MTLQRSIISERLSGWSKAIKWFFLLSFFLATGHWQLTTALAKEPISLNALIGEAKVNNPELQALRERIKVKEFAARVAGVLDDPVFRMDVMAIPKDRPFNLNDSMLTRYTFRQMFPFPGKLSLKQSIALKEVLVAGAELKDKELEIMAMIKDVYYDYAFINESIKIMYEIKDVLSYMAEVAQVRYSTGHVTQQDVLKIQTELTMLANEIISLEAEKEVAEARIKSILNRSQDTALGDPVRIKKDRIKIDTAQLITMALQNNPAIKAMEYEIQANELNVGLAEKNYYPDFMFDVGPVQREGKFDSWGFMLQLSLPIWRDKYDNQTREAQANVKVFQSMLSAEKNLKGFAVKSAAVKVEAAGRITTLYETSLLPQVELSFDSAMKNYQSGKIDFLSLLDAERTLKRTRIEYLGSIMDYRKKIAMLEKVVGEELDTAAGGK